MAATFNLSQELYANGVISEQKKTWLQAEITKTGKTEEDILLRNNIIAEGALFALKSKLLGIPLKKIDAEVPIEVLEMISQEAAVNYKMTPLFKKGNVVGVGMVYPENTLAQNALRFMSRKDNFKYEIYLITFSDLQTVLKQHKTLKRETKKALLELGKEIAPANEAAPEKEGSLVSPAEEAPIIKMVMVILRHAIEGDASDIHIEPSKDKLNIRFRQDGILHLSLFLPLSVHLSIVARVKILANLKIDENRTPQDGRFSATISGKEIDFRVSTFPTLYGEKVVLRVLDPSAGLKPFEKMGLSKRSLELISSAAKKPFGMILSSGPTGSGKSTTLYALLRILNQESVNIVTLEDPIEYSIEGVNQSQVKPEIGYSFSEGLRQILRQDPNIIMVGEIRDEETANLAIHSALTGHVVLSTLHTNSAVGVIPRLIDMGIKPFLIPSTLRIAISQRLIRTLCGHCKKKVKANEKIKTYIMQNLKNLPAHARENLVISNPLHVYEVNGCEQCNFKGYKGRIGLYEVLSMNEELADVILKNPVESAVLKVAQKQGMLTMAQEGMLKVLAGETTLDEITRVTEEN